MAFKALSKDAVVSVWQVSLQVHVFKDLLLSWQSHGTLRKLGLTGGMCH